MQEIHDMEDLNQFIFDTVSKHLLIQNAISMDGDSCRYRSDSGLKCAIGILIKDEYYSPELEGNDIGDDIVNIAIIKSLNIKQYSSVTENILFELQQIHDMYSTCSWPKELKRIAEEFGLKLNCID